MLSEYTYSTVVSAVDISSLVNKVFHYIKIVFLSCQVQGSILLKKGRKFNVYNKKFNNCPHSCLFKPWIILDLSRGQIYSFAAWGWVAPHLDLTCLKEALEVFLPDTISMLTQAVTHPVLFASLDSHISSLATFLDLSSIVAASLLLMSWIL